MTTANISRFAPVGVKNRGDAREWAVCAHMGVERGKHDSGAYDRDSDVNAGDLHISVKSSGFTLMSGNLCEGLQSFDAKVFLRFHYIQNIKPHIDNAVIAVILSSWLGSEQ